MKEKVHDKVYRIRVRILASVLRVDPFKYFEGGLRFPAFQEKFRTLWEGEQPQTQHYRG